MPFQGLMTMSWSPLPRIAIADERSLPASSFGPSSDTSAETFSSHRRNKRRSRFPVTGDGPAVPPERHPQQLHPGSVGNSGQEAR